MLDVKSDRTRQSDTGYLFLADKDSALTVPQYGGNLLCRNMEETCCAGSWNQKPTIPQQ
jgi:hypothetical protein